MSNRVKIIFGVVVLVLLVVAGALIVGYVTRPEVEEDPVISGGEVASILPVSPSNTFVVTQQQIAADSSVQANLLDPEPVQEIDTVFSPQFFEIGDDVFVVTQEGLIFTYENTGLRQKYDLAEEVTKVAISPNGDQALVKDEIEQNFLVDFSTNARTSLTEDIRDFAWSPDGSKIMYQFFDIFDRNYGIFVANPDTSDFERIIGFSGDDDFSEQNQIIWPLENTALYQPPSLSLEGVSLFQVNVAEKTESEIANGDSMNTFIVDGNKVLYSFLEFEDLEEGEPGDEGTFILKEYDIETGETRTIPVDALADNCTYVRDDIVCAISENLLDEAPVEALVRLQRSTGQVIPLVEANPNQPVDYDGIAFSDELNQIVYYNTYTNSIDKIVLE